MRRRKSTKTSQFGTSSKECHDSSDFYNSNLYRNLTIEDNKYETDNSIPDEILNKIFCKSSEYMDEIPDNSVHLIVTSPPYNVGKEYDDDLTLEQYLQLIQRVMYEAKRILVTGGRVCLNVANIGRKPYIPLSTYINNIMIQTGFLMRGEIIWDKGASAGQSTAWGSWMSAKNPVLRDTHEYILVYSKGKYSRQTKGHDTITKQEFLDYTKSIWTFPTVSAKNVGHPAPFPEEMPRKWLGV